MKVMKKWDIGHIVGRKLDDLVLYAFLLAVLGTTFLSSTHYFYTPLRVEGGWYSYPALSLSRGEDPGNNYERVDDVREIAGINVIFDVKDDFRRSIRIFPMALWFKALGTSIWAVKLYGIIEHIILLTFMFLVLRQITRDRNFLFLCFAIYLVDLPAIWYGSTNVRPDIIIAAVTLGVFLLVCMDDRKGHRMSIFLAGVLGIFLLPLIRINAAISLVLLLAYVSIELSLSWHNLSGFKKWFYISLIAAGIVGYLLRDHLLDLIISTRHSPQLPHGMDRLAYRIVRQKDLIWKLSKELDRWGEYFRLANIGTLVAVFLALGLLLARRLSGGNNMPKRKVMHIGLSALLAMVALAIFDPLRSVGHALTIVAFFILLLARELELISFPRMRKLVIPLLLLIVFSSAGIRFAQGINVAAKSVKNGFSNAAMVETMSNVFNSAGKKYVVFGSTELWPYFNPKTNVILIDFRHKYALNRLSEAIKSVDYIIIDKFYEEEKWEKNFLSRYPGIELKTIRQVGNPMSGWYFLKVTKPSVAG
jgi:hypothetical protein